MVSICREGILCHRLSRQRQHQSVAMQEIQDRRARKVVPGGRRLHEYANLYFHARNPMLFLRKDQHAELCVLRVSLAVLDLPAVVITSQNASSEYVKFYSSPGGLDHLDYDLVFAEYWTHPNDQLFQWRHKSIKCAEVLAPQQIAPELVFGAYVSNATTKSQMESLLRAEGLLLNLTVNGFLFFQGGAP